MDILTHKITESLIHTFYTPRLVLHLLTTYTADNSPSLVMCPGRVFASKLGKSSHFCIMKILHCIYIFKNILHNFKIHYKFSITNKITKILFLLIFVPFFIFFLLSLLSFSHFIGLSLEFVVLPLLCLFIFHNMTVGQLLHWYFPPSFRNHG